MYRIGIDIGGTKIAGGAVTEKGEIVVRRQMPFPSGAPWKEVAELVAGMVRELAEETSARCAVEETILTEVGDAGKDPFRKDGVVSVGIAVPGSLDSCCKTVLAAHNIGFFDVPLKEALEKRLERPVFLINDADAAALAELAGGVFAGHQSGLLLTLGTGLGAGIILNGRLFRGGLGHGAEAGHMVMDMQGETCTCGKRGCAETLCSAKWLAQEGKRLAEATPLGVLAKKSGGISEMVDARMVIEAAREKDVGAEMIVRQYVRQLGTAIASLANILDPEVIAIGGGISGAGEFLLGPLKREVERRNYYGFAYPVVKARMGNEAGIVGAAMLSRYDPR